MTTVTQADVMIQRAVRMFHLAEPDRIRDVCLGDCHLRRTVSGGQVVVIGGWTRNVLAIYDVTGDGILSRRPRTRSTTSRS